MTESYRTYPHSTLFRKKPVEVEAHRWMDNDDFDTGAFGNDHMANWLGDRYIGIQGTHLTIHTLEGYLEARLGDWIVKGVAGEFYPVRPDIFAATYEPVYPLYSLSESGEIKRIE